MWDGSTQLFRHLVGERLVRAEGAGNPGSLAERVLATIAVFRFNGKHLDIWFEGGSRWEVQFP
jgi:hypothetical protein